MQDYVSSNLTEKIQESPKVMVKLEISKISVGCLRNSIYWHILKKGLILLCVSMELDRWASEVKMALLDNLFPGFLGYMLGSQRPL